MAFNELQIKVAAETAIMGLQPHMASLKYFAHNFKELEDKKGSAIAVPVYSLTDAADFDTNSNNWGSGENEIQGEVLNLEKHLIKSIGLDDVAAGATDINFLRDGTKAIVDVLAHAANKYVYGMINETNCPTSETFTGSDKTAFANLFKIASDNGVNPYEAVVVLNPEMYAKVLSFLDAVVYSNDQAVKYGVVEGLYGFRAVIASSYLPAGVKGAIIPYQCVGIASRINKPAVDGYVSTWTASTEDGFTLGFRVYEDLAKGVARLGADVLMGARLFQADKIIRLA
jgi:hypothetical protein